MADLDGQPDAPRLGVLRDEVRAMRAYHVPDASGLIKLDAMENPFSLPPELARELGERLSRVALNRYPPADPAEFKRQLAESAGLPPGKALMLGNGSDELIHLMVQACARHGPSGGAVVLAPTPSFVMYEVFARLDGCRFVGVPLQPDFRLDMAALLRAVEEHRPALLFVAYPNNPTGNLFARAEIQILLDRAPGLVVIDEAYCPFALETWMPQLAGRPNLVVLRTLSKLGLAGLRLGYACADPRWIVEFDKVRPPYNVGVLPLAAAAFLLDHFDVLQQQASVIRSERGRLLGALRGLPGVTAFDSDANFILLRVSDPERLFAGLRTRGILVKNVSGSHPLLWGCLRVTVGTPQENDALLQALGALS
ncbi:MAG TPA: histidinol-phosphate transaminase [Burkholderiaceae bacterium]